MTLGTLLLLAPLANGFHPNKAHCDTGGCPPVAPAMPVRPTYLAPMPGMMPPLIPQACPPGPPAPLLAVKFVGPKSFRVTAAPGTPDARMYPGGSVFGFRPGYVYRLEIAGVPNQPDARLYPEIEVRGTLFPRANFNYMDYPAAINLTDLDLAKAAAGVLVTKVIYLENPEKALPVASSADRPIEQIADTEPDAIAAAFDNGRPVMVVRIGNRVPTNDELAKLAIPGTILHPGEQALGKPTVGPMIGWNGVPLYDPISGPKPPTEECFTDGGDTNTRLGIRDAGTLGGLDSTDVAVEYTRLDKRRVATSNTVCICVPRFAVQRAELIPAGLQFAFRLESGTQRFASQTAKIDTHTGVVKLPVKPVGYLAAIRPQAQVGRQGAEIIVGTSAVKAVYTVQGVQSVVVATEADEITNADEFSVVKSVEPKSGVKIGDVVTITIRYRNGTNHAVGDVVVSDSLSPRLEYVSGSGESDRPTNVTTEPNTVGSQIVKFEIPGTIAPGQEGVVKFKAKVR
jgi:uncharacterized repeat protein (TIGR01451 family)